jgi:hypothetical protein
VDVLRFKAATGPTIHAEWRQWVDKIALEVQLSGLDPAPQSQLQPPAPAGAAAAAARPDAPPQQRPDAPTSSQQLQPPADMSATLRDTVRQLQAWDLGMLTWAKAEYWPVMMRRWDHGPGVPPGALRSPCSMDPLWVRCAPLAPWTPSGWPRPRGLTECVRGGGSCVCG